MFRRIFSNGPIPNQDQDLILANQKAFGKFFLCLFPLVFSPQQILLNTYIIFRSFCCLIDDSNSDKLREAAKKFPPPFIKMMTLFFKWSPLDLPGPPPLCGITSTHFYYCTKKFLLHKNL